MHAFHFEMFVFYKLFQVAEVEDWSLSAFHFGDHRQVAGKSCIVIVF